MNIYQILRDAPSQRYLIENFYPIYNTFTEDIDKLDDDSMTKFNPEIIKILQTYTSLLAEEQERLLVKQYIDDVLNKPEDKNTQRGLPVIACGLFQTDLYDYTTAMGYIHSKQRNKSNFTPKKKKRKQ